MGDEIGRNISMKKTNVYTISHRKIICYSIYNILFNQASKEEIDSEGKGRSKGAVVILRPDLLAAPLEVSNLNF